MTVEELIEKQNKIEKIFRIRFKKIRIFICKI